MSFPTPKTIKAQRISSILERLMHNPGRFTHIPIHSCVTKRKRKEIFEQVTSMLRMMGVKYEVKPGTYKLRVLTEEQIKKTQLFSERMGLK